MYSVVIKCYPIVQILKCWAKTRPLKASTWTPGDCTCVIEQSQPMCNTGWVIRGAGHLQVSETWLNSLCSSVSFGVEPQRHNVNNPTTSFGPWVVFLEGFGPWGTAVAASGASDTCWPLPSLPDWQMAAPLDENDNWLSVHRRDFLLTPDSQPWLLTPLRGWHPLPSPPLSLLLFSSKPSTGAGQGYVMRREAFFI